MNIEFGNTITVDGAPVPDVLNVKGLPDGEEYGYQPHESAEQLASKLARHLMVNAGGVTRVGDISDGTGHHEAFLHAYAHWQATGNGTPAWVWSDNPDFAVLLGAFYGCPVGRPDDVEMTHYTESGPPGVGPVTVAPTDPTSSDADREDTL